MPLSLKENSQNGSSLVQRRSTIARRLAAAELQRVAEQVLEHRGEQRQLGQHQRQVPDLDGGAGLLHRRARLSLAWASAASLDDQRGLARGPPHPAERQQVVDQRLHPLGAVDGELDVLVGPVVQLARVAALQQLAEARHLAQRLLQVVRGDVGELLELGVRALQLLGLRLAGRSLRVPAVAASSARMRSRMLFTSAARLRHLPRAARVTSCSKSPSATWRASAASRCSGRIAAPAGRTRGTPRWPQADRDGDEHRVQRRRRVVQGRRRPGSARR